MWVIVMIPKTGSFMRATFAGVFRATITMIAKIILELMKGWFPLWIYNVNNNIVIFEHVQKSHQNADGTDYVLETQSIYTTMD